MIASFDLTEGTQGSAVYQTTDLIIEYQWVRSGNELQLSGLAKFTSRIQNSFTMIPVFDLSLFLTDAQGIILEQRCIATPGDVEPGSRMRSARSCCCRRERRTWPSATADRPATAMASEKTRAMGICRFGKCPLSDDCCILADTRAFFLTSGMILRRASWNVSGYPGGQGGYSECFGDSERR